MKENKPVVNVHKPPSIEVPVKIVDCLTSFTNSSPPGSWFAYKGMKILRDDKFFPEMGGLGSGDTLSILNMYESSYWTHSQRR